MAGRSSTGCGGNVGYIGGTKRFWVLFWRMKKVIPQGLIWKAAEGDEALIATISCKK